MIRPGTSMTWSDFCVTNPFFWQSLSTGKERDAESGNDYFGARYYASSMGRFMSPDWSAKVEPVPYSKMDDPQSLNLYEYVYNNPMTGVDPDGHLSCKDAPALCAAITDAVNRGMEAGHALVAGAEAYAKGDFGPLPPKSLTEHKPPKAPGTPKWHWSQKKGSMDLKVDRIQVQHAGTGYSGRGTGVNIPSVDDHGDPYAPNWGPTPLGEYQIGPAYSNRKTGPISMDLTPDDPNSVYGRGPFLIHGAEKGERIGIDPPVSSEGCQVLPPNARLTVAGSGVTDEEVDQ
ncbi:MAG: RHS repeat-associated core domain-containing protein [Candidatus Sulfotelmatobacter sp.]